MILTTTDSVPGRTVTEILGVVTIGDDHEGDLNISDVPKKLKTAAKALGADAVIGLRMGSSTYYDSEDDEVSAAAYGYGTAVRLD